MKNLSFILSLMSFLGVIYLLVDRFSGATGKTAASVQEIPGAKIVFVKADTLLSKYDYFKQKMEELAKKEQEATTALQTRGKALESEMLGFQKRAQSGTVAPAQLQAEEQRLLRKQQSLMQDQEKISQELLMQSQELQNELQTKVKDMLATLQKTKGFDYVLSYATGTGVLMVNDSLDITEEVLKQLNGK